MCVSNGDREKGESGDDTMSEKMGGSIWESSMAGFTKEALPDSVSLTEPVIMSRDSSDKTVGPSIPPDYSNLPSLHGAPRAGDIIAFKVLDTYSTDQMQCIRQIRLPSHVNAFVSLYIPN